MSFVDRPIGQERNSLYDPKMRSLVHHMRNNLQVIRGELDLLNLMRAMPRQSFENIDRCIDRLHDLLAAITALSEAEPFCQERETESHSG